MPDQSNDSRPSRMLRPLMDFCEGMMSVAPEDDPADENYERDLMVGEIKRLKGQRDALLAFVECEDARAAYSLDQNLDERETWRLGYLETLHRHGFRDGDALGFIAGLRRAALACVQASVVPVEPEGPTEPQLNALDWAQAAVHLNETEDNYRDAGRRVPGANVGFVLAHVIPGLRYRIASGERTPELHAEIMALE